MKIIMPMALSIDGKLTYKDKSLKKDWISAEDHSYFKQLLSHTDALVMGRVTYEAMKPTLNDTRLHIVLTKDPEHYSSDQKPGFIEFMNISPEQIIDDLREKGYQNIMIAGGTKIYEMFIQKKLVDEIHLTLEPYIIGEGVPFAWNVKLMQELQLKETRQFNERGTRLFIYTLK